jgi:hypothetical protein
MDDRIYARIFYFIRKYYTKGIMSANSSNKMVSGRMKCLTSYLCAGYDFHKNKQLSANNFDYIKEYYDSVFFHNLKSVIIADNMDKTFIEKYSNMKIQFSIVETDDHMLLHDRRFCYFLKYILEDVTTEYYLLSDVSDVIVLNKLENVLDVDNNTIYVCREGENIDTNKWFDEYIIYIKKLMIDDMYGDYNDVFKNKVINNCGAIFGHRHIIIRFLVIMIGMMKTIYDKSKENINRPLDMFATNYVLYKHFSDNLYKGNSFNTPFWCNVYDNTKFIKHK